MPREAIARRLAAQARGEKWDGLDAGGDLRLIA
jgi:hypothetical protein